MRRRCLARPPPAFAQMHRVLKRDAFCVSFYGCYQIDLFMAAWRTAGFRSVGHIVFTKIHFKDPHRLRYQASAGPKATRPRRNMPARDAQDNQPNHLSGSAIRQMPQKSECCSAVIEQLRATQQTPEKAPGPT